MRRLATALCTGLFLFLLPSFALSQVPRLISYQGVLTDTLGTPKPDGPYNLTFRFYKSETGGSAIWFESKTLPLKHGLFSTMLGDQTAFPDSVNFTVPYWLSVQVGPDELAPRVRLGSVGYAIRAISADTAKFVLNAGSVQRPISPGISNAELADNAVTSAKIQDSTITSTDVRPDFKAPRADTASVALIALSSAPTGSAGGALSGSYPNPGIADNAVTSASIANGTVTTADVSSTFKAPKADTADYALTAVPAANSVGTSALQDGAVTSAKISNGTITTADLASSFVAPKADTATYALAALSSAPTGLAGGDLSGTFPNPSIADSAVTSSKIKINAVTDAKIAGMSASKLTGALPALNGSALTNLNAASLSSGSIPDARFSGTYSNQLSLTNSSNVFTGNGSNLTALNASNLSQGTVPSARLDSSVAKLYSENLLSTSSEGFSLRQTGIGTGAIFTIANPSSNGAALGATSNGTGFSLVATNFGTGQAANFAIGNAASTNSALNAYTIGLGRAAHLYISNDTNTNEALGVSTNGLGNAGYFEVLNTSSAKSALEAATNGTGYALYARASGSTGGAGKFSLSSGNNNTSLWAETAGNGIALQAVTSGSGYAGVFGGDVLVNGNVTVNDTALVVDKTDNRVGVGTKSPVSSLDVQGSFGMKVVNVDGETTDAGDAGLFLINSVPSAVTINLPEAAKAKGRVYYFVVVSSEYSHELQAYGSDLIEGSSTFSFVYKDFTYNRVMLVCDGTSWHIVFAQYL